MYDFDPNKSVLEMSTSAIAFECGMAIGTLHAFLSKGEGSKEDALQCVSRLFMLNHTLVNRVGEGEK